MRKRCAERGKISLLKDEIRKQFYEKLVDGGLPKLWGHFKDGVLKASDEMCGSKRRCIGDTWWWNEEVKEAVSGEKDAHIRCIWIVLRRIRGGMNT